MSGDVQTWDVAKCKPVSPVFNTPCATAFAWAPDGRTLLAATTRPRLMVDNGWRVWSYKGQLLQHVAMDALFDAAWRPAAAAAPFADRPPTPPPRGDRGGAKAAKAAAAAGGEAGAGAGAPAAGAGAGAGAGSGMGLSSAPRAKAGAYVPPHLRGAGPGASAVVELMSEGHKKAGKVGAAAEKATAAAPPRKVVQAPVVGAVYVSAPPAAPAKKK
jgi:translation initiation factor 2A